MVAQTVIILYFSYWAVSEYNNNYYFQAYLNSVFQGSGGSGIILGTVGVGACHTTSELIDTKVRSTDDRLALGWTRPIRPPSGRPVAPPI